MVKVVLEPDVTKLTPEQRDKLEAYQQTETQLQTLQDIADMTQEVVNILDDQKKDTKVENLGVLLTDIRESLSVLKDKEAPETPDYAKPVVEAVNRLEKELTKSISKIDTKPEIKVDAPAVNVAPPNVDLKGVEKALGNLPKAFEQAIKLIPKAEIPEQDFTPLLSAWEGISEQLQSIENATRAKSEPGSIKVTNVDGSAVGGDGLTDTQLRAAPVEVTGTVSTTAPVGGATEAKQDAIITELTQKTEPDDVQNVDIMNAVRTLLQQVALPSWYDPSTNTLRVGTTAVTVSSGTVTTVATVTNLTNFGTNAADVMARDISINTWANNSRRTIT